MTSVGMECYEDMFKEITKKLYEETDMEAGETMRILQDYDGETFKLEEGHNSLNAFGLAALVQNGFQTNTLFSLSAQQELEKLRAEEDTWIASDESIPWTESKIASYNSAQKLFRCNECECVGFLSRVAEHWLGTHANLRVFQCPQCPYASAWARCVRMHLARQHNVCPDPNQESLTLWKENPVLEEVTKYLERLKNLVESELAKNQEKEDSDEESHQNAISTQTSTPPPDSPHDQQSLSPVDEDEEAELHHEQLQDEEMHQHELHQRLHHQELHQQELHQQELHQQELHQQELHQQELHQQELHQQELHQQGLHQQELHHQEIEEQELHQELEQQELHHQEIQQQQLHQQELHQQELHDQELNQQDLHQQELHQQELHQQELHQQELHEQELRDQDLQQHELKQEYQQHELEQEYQQQDMQQQDLQDIDELQGQEITLPDGQITHVIEEHIQVPEEVATQLQQIAAAQHGDGHPQLQIVITQQENQDLPPTIQIQIAPSADLGPHLVSTAQQTIPLQQVGKQFLTQSLASTLSPQLIARAAQTVVNQPITRQIVVQQPTVVQSAQAVAPSRTSTISPSSRSKQTQSENSTTSTSKRYTCSFCHYATDRRDLYTRHENIHRDEKPFHCYICTRQFNRADHVKKHFLRMHRDTPYDIHKIKRTTSKDSSSSKSTVQYYFPKPQPRQAAEQVETVAVQSISVPGFTTQKPEDKKSSKRKPGEKRYTCSYCTWSGMDNWCLKRHLNTHLKPYVCTLCEYKAARSERLATHVFKVHNKRACSRCSFLADDQAQLQLHQQQNHHPNYCRPPQMLENYHSKGNENIHFNSTNEWLENYRRNPVKAAPSLPPLEVQRILSCILCGMQTSSQAKMLQHMEFHSDSEPLDSASADSSDDGDELLEIPLLTIIEEDYSQESDLSKTLWEKHKRKTCKLYCGLCRSTNSKSSRFSKTSFARHFLFSHSRRTYSCSLCRDNFRHRYQVDLHKKFKHNYFR